MDAVAIILLAFGLQAAVLAVLITASLVRIGIKHAPSAPHPALSAWRPQPSERTPVAPWVAVAPVRDLSGFEVVATSRHRQAA